MIYSNLTEISVRYSGFSSLTEYTTTQKACLLDQDDLEKNFIMSVRVVFTRSVLLDGDLAPSVTQATKMGFEANQENKKKHLDEAGPNLTPCST